MSWAGRRRSMYTLGLFIFFAIVVGIPSFLYFYEAPTCFDGAHNQDELGVDCGGVCELLCEQQITDPIVLWSRAVEVSPGIFNAIAYVDNANFDARVLRAPYIFKLFDDEGILIKERHGETFINPNGITPVFEGSIETGVRKPTKTFFEFSEPLSWHIVNEEIPEVVVTGKILIEEETTPKVAATVHNETIDDFFDIEVIAVVFDENDNAFAASQTFIDLLPKRSSLDLTFTWPRPFSRSVSTIEIIPRPSPGQ